MGVGGPSSQSGRLVRLFLPDNPACPDVRDSLSSPESGYAVHVEEREFLVFPSLLRGHGRIDFGVPLSIFSSCSRPHPSQDVFLF